MSFIVCALTEFKDSRDSGYRVNLLDGGTRNFLLNPSHMSEIVVDPTSALKSKFKYFDNHLNRREGYAKVKANVTVAVLQTAADTAFDSNFITLPIHRDNNPDKATTDFTMPVDCISYATAYNPDPTNHCWVCYYLAGFKRREVLCHLSIEDIEYLSATGSTTNNDVTPR
jgi:hypothetical protein